MPILLVPAGTRAWGKGRLFVLIFLLSAIAAFLYIWQVNPEVAIARSRPQEGAKRWGRILASFFLLRRSGPSSPWRPSTRIEDHLM